MRGRSAWTSATRANAPTAAARGSAADGMRSKKCYPDAVSPDPHVPVTAKKVQV